MPEFDPARAWLRGPDSFPRFVVEPGAGAPLAAQELPADTELLVAERDGASIAFVMRELSHPHMAQGELAGKPYLVTF